MKAPSGTLGIKVQAYVLVDMDGFAKLIDAMGGITGSRPAAGCPSADHGG